MCVGTCIGGEQIMPTDPLRLAALAAVAIADIAPDSPTWQRDMERVITRAHTAAWLAGTAERLRVKLDSPLLSQARLSRAERAEIKAVVEKQLEYLAGFVEAKGGLSEAQVAARAAMYAGAVQKTYSESRWGDWDLPFYPTDGSECMANCRCSWEVNDNDDGTGVAYWRLGATERHCTTCPAREADNPYQVKRRAA